MNVVYKRWDSKRESGFAIFSRTEMVKGKISFKKTGKNNEIKIGDLRVSTCNSSSANFTITDK